MKVLFAFIVGSSSHSRKAHAEKSTQRGYQIRGARKALRKVQKRVY